MTGAEETSFGLRAEKVTFSSHAAAELEATTQISTPLKKRDSS